MKKSILVIGLLATTILSAHAQFKVHSDGKISINTTATPNCPISINHAGNSDFYMSYQSTKPFLYAGSDGGTCSSFVLFPTANTGFAMALSGLCQLSSQIQNPNLIGIGTIGRAFGIPYSIGSLGIISNSTVGAGVMGASTDTIPYTGLLEQKYAGLFYGDVKVTGGSIFGSVVSRSAPSRGSMMMQEVVRQKGGSITSLLSGLNAYAYHHDVGEEDAEVTYETILLSDSTTMTLASADEGNYIGRQSVENTHYALEADQLEKAFPGLVYEMADGTKGINYVEMVPLLVQSINELNSRIQELESNGDAKAASRASVNTSVGAGPVPARSAMLYQNTPNPFSSQTEIHFSLPDDAKNANIYIFDMTGKMQKQIAVDPSMQSVTINGYELQAGIYLYSLVVGGQEIDTIKMILSK